MKTQYELIREWAVARNLIEGSTPKDQFVKLVEEFGELRHARANYATKAVADAVGDCTVVLTIILAHFDMYIEDAVGDVDNLRNSSALPLVALGKLAEYLARGQRPSDEIIGNLIRHLYDVAAIHGLSFEACVLGAWNEIKDRKGRMVDGVFVKEGE